MGDMCCGEEATLRYATHLAKDAGVFVKDCRGMPAGCATVVAPARMSTMVIV